MNRETILREAIRNGRKAQVVFFPGSQNAILSSSRESLRTEALVKIAGAHRNPMGTKKQDA